MHQPSRQTTALKISNGVVLKTSFEKELDEEPFKEEKLTDNIKQEAAKNFIKSEEEDLYQLITKMSRMKSISNGIR